jgi:phosphatidate cytidylyltransferase
MLWQRVATALVLGPVVLAIILWAPFTVAAGLYAVALLAGAWEWSAFPRFKGRGVRIVYVVATAALMVCGRVFTRTDEQLQLLLIAAAIWWAMAFVWLTAWPARATRMTAAIAGFLVLVPAWVALARLQQFGERGHEWVLFLLFLVWAADVGAYFAGRRFGRLKLAPLVSPGKTWEGVIGGLLASGLIMIGGVFRFDVPVVPFVGLCCAVVLISIVGDLTESSFKRYAGLKDSGQLLPGHGGMLDRIDSVSAAAPIFVLGLSWLGVVR